MRCVSKSLVSVAFAVHVVGAAIPHAQAPSTAVILNEMSSTRCRRRCALDE